MGTDGTAKRADRKKAEDVDADGNTALHRLLAVAALAGGSETSMDPVQRMLSADADVNASNTCGETPLLSLLRTSGSPESTRALCKLLVRARADPNCGDSITGESPLMEAACLGDRRLCLLLLHARADTEQCNSNGQHARDVAVTAGHSNLLQLLARGAATAERGEEPVQSDAWPQQQRCGIAEDKLCESRMAESAVPTPQSRGRPRGRGGFSSAMQKRCEDRGVPLEILGLLGASELLREMDRWQSLTDAELLSEWGSLGNDLEQGSLPSRDELSARLKQLRLWQLLPLEVLQDVCRREAGHVVAAEEGPLSRTELVEALTVATWGGLTKTQQTSKRCAERGIPDKKLENRERAEHLLQEFDKLDALKEADLIRQYKSKGFAHSTELSKDDLLSALKENMLFQEMSLSHLRQICKEKNLAIRGEHRRAELIGLVTAESWRQFKIPVTKLPSLLVAQGLLDQVQRFLKKDIAQLRHECRKRNLPAESHPNKTDLVNRLRNHLVWSQMTAEGLKEECQNRGLKWQQVQVADGSTHMLKMHAERAEKKEMIDSLHFWLITEMLELKGIPVETVGRECALSIFAEIERYETMPSSLLQAEYATLGMPTEPNLDDKELLRRLKQVLIWSQFSVDDLIKECEARELSTTFPGRPSEADKIQVLMDRLILSLGVDGWEKQGIPVYRLTSLEAAIVIVEELGRLEGLKQADVSAAYRLLGLPPEVLDKAAMMSRLKHYLVWQELRPAELRKECVKHGIPAMGDPEELIAQLVLKNWGVLPEEWEAPDPPDWSQFLPPPRQNSRPTPAPPSAKVASAFRELGLDVSASHEQVRKAYRKLALQYHPDKNPGLQQEQAVKKFQAITSSYETVLDHMKKLAF